MAHQAVITRTLVALTAAFLAAFFAPTAQAMMCFDAKGMANFHKQYGEHEVARGSLGNDGHKMLLLANPKTGSWTMIIVRVPDGLMCPFSSGNNFKIIQPSIKGQKIQWTL